MLFNSYIFILLFLPIMLVGYFVLNKFFCRRVPELFVLAMCFWFYAYFDLKRAWVIVLSITINWVFQYLLAQKQKKSILTLGIVFNLSLLGYFKYTNFLLQNIYTVLGKEYQLLNIALPLGISFFTFQQISVLIDTYRGELERCSFVDYATYVSYFPQLIAGPIVMHDELMPQIKDSTNKTVDYNNLAVGIYVFTLGLAKKVLLADVFGNAVNWGYANIDIINSIDAFIITLGYTFQIYFDFSGYCDMAIGIARMMNIELPINFNSPYKAKSIGEFWKRWHMTLTRFLTKYLYIPLGGNKKGMVRTYLNILIVFIVSGIWHGAAWTFVLWGCCHGFASILERVFKEARQRIPNWICWCYTFALVNILWIFFRADSIRTGFRVVHRIVMLKIEWPHTEILESFNTPIAGALLNGKAFGGILPIAYFGVAIYFSIVAKNVQERAKGYQLTLVNAVGIGLLLVVCVMSLSGISDFLYFNF